MIIAKTTPDHLSLWFAMWEFIITNLVLCPGPLLVCFRPLLDLGCFPANNQMQKTGAESDFNADMPARS